MLAHPQWESVWVEFWNGIQTTWLITPPGQTIAGQPGDALSLVPLGGDAQDVTTEGLQYPLRNKPLMFGPARGVSNVFTASRRWQNM